MTSPFSPVVGRLAPSPTGGLHVGHARTFLVAWLAARSVGGRIVLRIEDIDASRVKPEAIKDAILDLQWLGLDWDEGPDLGGPHLPYLQSQRRDRYDAVLNVLKQKERVYPCTCTRADIARAASAPHAEDEGPVYPGTCAARTAKDSQTLQNKPYCWRFRVNPGPVVWHDLIRGSITGNPVALGGDFLVGRSSGEPSYQLAVVCDDHEMGINQVIRGDDLIPSTPRQILIYRAMGWAEPRFGHVPLVLDPDGRRLAKRDGSIKLAAYRESGVDPRRLIAAIAKSLGIDDVADRVRPGDLSNRFQTGNLTANPWIFDTSSVSSDTI